jgi:hypothetical protein
MIAELQRSRDVIAGSVGKTSCPRSPSVFCLEPLDRPLSGAADCFVVIVDRFKLAESVSTAMRAAIPTDHSDCNSYRKKIDELHRAPDVGIAPRRMPLRIGSSHCHFCTADREKGYCDHG